MRSTPALPEGYTEVYAIDLQKNKKMALLVNVLALVIAAAMVIPMLFVVPISHLFETEQGIGIYFIRLGVMVLSMVAYMVLHELVHGIAMKICGTKKVKYGFTGMYAFAGSDDYYAKGPYIFIALAPVVLWGIVLAVINVFVPLSWFWIVYFIQIINCAGAAGDLFVTVRFLCLPKDVWIKDHGVGMTVYGKE